MNNRLYTFIQIFAALSFSLASIIAPSLWAVILVFFTAFSWIITARKSQHLYFDFFVFGFIFNAISFYWLTETIDYFGGFGKYLSILIFFIYSITHSLQFVFAAYLYNRFKLVDRYALVFPAIWVFCEYFFPRMFPWALANPVISFTALSSLAKYFGVYFLSGFILWWISLLLQRRYFSATTLVLLLLVNNYSTTNYKVDNYFSLNIGIVQANIDAKDVINPDLKERNLDSYRKLSNELKSPLDLIIWPESSANYWIPDDIKELNYTNFDPFPEKQSKLIFGSSSYLIKDKNLNSKKSDNYFKYNTVFASDSSGNILGTYHKQVLMPFGEYMPFANLFPIIKQLSPETGDLTPGKNQLPISLDKLKVGALICYEDLIPSVSSKAARDGANILINFSNDAWYGTSYAQAQHNLLASWRAIETARYLLRSTNTGYTTVISPKGEILKDLEAFKSGILEYKLDINETPEITFYSKFADIFPWLSFSLMILFQNIYMRKK